MALIFIDYWLMALFFIDYWLMALFFIDYWLMALFFIEYWAQLFKINDVVSKTVIIKYGIYANIFAEKMWVAFAFAKATHIFSAKVP